jgi:hypothetical protein
MPTWPGHSREIAWASRDCIIARADVKVRKIAIPVSPISTNALLAVRYLRLARIVFHGLPENARTSWKNQLSRSLCH